MGWFTRERRVPGLAIKSPATLVLQFPPQKRTVKADYGYYRLAFPHTIFVVNFGTKRGLFRTHYQFASMHVFVRDRALQTVNDEVFRIPLSNVDGNGHVCMGNSMRQTEFRSMADLAEAAVGAFWMSEFTNSDGLRSWMKLGEFPDDKFMYKQHISRHIGPGSIIHVREDQ